MLATMARRKGQRSNVRSPAKSMERELVHRAEQLAKDPGRALPKISPPCTKDPFSKVRKKMEQISKFADDEEKLKRFANRGDDIVKAYAGTLMLSAAGKAPYLATIKLPQGEVFYALRGKAKKEKLAGMQWFDHPVYRLLLYLDMAARRPYYHFYSTRDALYCSCKEARPPREYIEFAMQQPKANMSEASPGLWTCPHIDPQAVKEEEPVDDTYLRLEWRSAGILVGLCKRCARTSRDSALLSITKHMAVPKVGADFDVQVLHRLQGAEGCQLWDRLSRMKLKRDDHDAYINGEVDDLGLIELHLKAVGEELEGYKGSHFILEDRTYCDDVEAFLEALAPSDEERLALEAILPDLDHPLVLDRATTSKVLGELWEDHGEVALRAVVGGDEELLSKYLDDPEVASNPSNVLKRALVDHRKRTIISRLPEYPKLPKIAAFADRVARVYRTKGADGALRAIEKARGSDTRIKSVAYSFLLALGRSASKKWQYDRTEIDFANFLRDKAKALLDAKADEYHEALQALLSATGSTERIPEPLSD
jgi:hypothetical protein